jgi:hypothetical protein
MGMSSDPQTSSVADLVAENQRLRRLAELLHDHFAPADNEQFPQHGEEICEVFFMDPAQQDLYWFTEARRALGLQPSSAGSERDAAMRNRNTPFHIGISISRVH